MCLKHMFQTRALIEGLMNQKDTVTKILDAAESLFAENGFTETSTRAITQLAGVNVAAVNYHFGSKKDLIQAVFARFLDPFCSYLNKNLNDFEASLEGQQADLVSVLSVLEFTLTRSLRGENNPSDQISNFLRLLGLAYTQSQGHMRRFLREHYFSTYIRFIKAIQSTRPEYSPEDLFWRIHFAVGSMIFTFSNLETLRSMAATDPENAASVEKIIKMLIDYISGGINHN